MKSHPKEPSMGEIWQSIKSILGLNKKQDKMTAKREKEQNAIKKRKGTL